MNLPETIQRLRKQAGMSQEALAGALGISRQAVSKWESGTAMPEVEKLIELARIFSVSLDELFGLPAGDSSPSASSDASPTADVEDLLRRALAQSGAIYARHYKRLLAAVGVLGAVALLVLSLFVNAQVKDVQRELDNQTNRLQDNIAHLESRLYSLNQSQSQPSSDALLSYRCVPTKIDLSSSPGSIALSLSATLKEYKEGTAARFVVTSEGSPPVTVNAVRGSDGAFAAEATTTLSDRIDIQLLLSIDGTERTEPVDTLYDLAQMCILDIYPGYAGGYSHSPGDNIINFHLTPMIDFTCNGAEQFRQWGLAPVNPVSAKMVLYKNDTVLATRQLDIKAVDSRDGVQKSASDSTQDSAEASLGYNLIFHAEGAALEKSYDYQPGDRFVLQYEITDNYGRTFTDNSRIDFSIAENGELVSNLD